MALDIVQPTINGRVAIGEKHAEKGYPVKLDYFIFTHQFDKAANKAPRHIDMTKVMKEKYQTEKPKSIDITLIHHHPEEVFFSSYMNYPGKDCNCKGDGVTAIRVMPDGEKKELECNYSECKFRLQTKSTGILNTCKPTGILTFLIPEAPVAGGLWKFTTHSIMSIGKINSTLMSIYKIRGTLYGLNVKMKVVMVQLKVDGKATNVPTIELEVPFSYDAIAEGAGTTIGTLLDAKTQHKTLGMKPSAKVMQELSTSAEANIVEEDKAIGIVSSAIDAEIVDEPRTETPIDENDFLI